MVISKLHTWHSAMFFAGLVMNDYRLVNDNNDNRTTGNLTTWTSGVF